MAQSPVDSFNVPMNVLLLGAGYSAREIASVLSGDADVTALYGTTRRKENTAALLAAGITPVVFDGMTVSESLDAVLASVTHIVVSVSPVRSGVISDSADALIIERLAQRQAARSEQDRVTIVYLSTIGVYGDHHGAWVDETTPCKPVSERSIQRLDAEARWLSLAERAGHVVSVFRLSGIYGPGRNAFVNLEAGRARRINLPGQYFNRIHVTDIATAVTCGLQHSVQGVFNITDAEPAPGHEVITYAAELGGYDKPPMIDFADADLSPMAQSFYGENKRVRHLKSLTIPGMQYRYPNYRDGLTALYRSGDWRTQG